MRGWILKRQTEACWPDDQSKFDNKKKEQPAAIDRPYQFGRTIQDTSTTITSINEKKTENTTLVTSSTSIMKIT